MGHGRRITAITCLCTPKDPAELGPQQYDEERAVFGEFGWDDCDGVQWN